MSQDTGSLVKRSTTWLLLVILGTLISSGVGALTTIIYLRITEPPTPTGRFISFGSGIPAIGPSSVIEFTVHKLPSGWHPYVVVSAQPSTLFPESEGAKCSPFAHHHCWEEKGWFADGVTIGSTHAETYLVVADHLGSYALASCIHYNDQLKSTLA